MKKRSESRQMQRSDRRSGERKGATRRERRGKEGREDEGQRRWRRSKRRWTRSKRGWRKSREDGMVRLTLKELSTKAATMPARQKLMAPCLTSCFTCFSPPLTAGAVLLAVAFTSA